MKLNQSKSSVKKSNVKNVKVAILLPRFNDELGLELLKNTEAGLQKHGVKNVTIYRVPGALELPYAALKLAKSKKYHVIIALGIVIRGETKHFDLVTEECHRGLMQVSLTHEIPIIFGVLATENKKQALDRISANKMNKGGEFAEAAIEMAEFHG